MRRSGRSIALGAVLLAFPIAVGAQEVFGGGDEVRIEVYAHRDGEVMSLHDPRPLRLLVDGESASFEWSPDEPLAVAAVLDLSSSVSGDRLEAVITGFQEFLSGLGDEDRCAVIAFTRTVIQHAGWDTTCAEAADAVSKLVSGGPAARNNGVMLALGLLADAPGRPVLAMFTDGDDGASWTPELWPMIAIRGIAPMVLAVTAPAAVRGGGTVRGAYNRVNEEEDMAVYWRYEGRFVQIEKRDLDGMRDVDPFASLTALGRATGGGVISTSGTPDTIRQAIASLRRAIDARVSLRFRPPPNFASGRHTIVVESDVGEAVHRTEVLWPGRRR